VKLLTLFLKNRTRLANILAQAIQMNRQSYTGPAVDDRRLPVYQFILIKRD